MQRIKQRTEMPEPDIARKSETHEETKSSRTQPRNLEKTADNQHLTEKFSEIADEKSVKKELISIIAKKPSFGFANEDVLNTQGKRIIKRINSILSDQKVEFKYLGNEKLISEWFALESRSGKSEISRFKIDLSPDTIKIELERTKLYRFKNGIKILNDSMIKVLKRIEAQ